MVEKLLSDLEMVEGYMVLVEKVVEVEHGTRKVEEVVTELVH